MNSSRIPFGNRRPPAKKLLDVIQRVRRRWRLKLALRGAVIVTAVALTAFLISSFGLESLRFSSSAVLTFRILTYVAVAAAAIRFLVWPFTRKVSDEQVALYLEEHEPELEAAVMTAVDAHAHSHESFSPQLTDGVIEAALERARKVDFGRRIEQTSLYRSTGILAVAAAAGLIGLLFGPGFLRHGASTLLFPTRSASAVNPYRIDVTPGDITISRNSDQLISAGMIGFDSDAADLFVRPDGASEFERLSMLPPLDVGESHELLLLNVAEDTDYFVESTGTRSETFRITVADLPYVDRLEMEYIFPAYTGLPPRTIDTGGDIAVVRGTTVRLVAYPTMATPGGAVIVDEKTSIPLEVQEDGTLTGEMQITEDGIYWVDLNLADGTPIEASPHYAIDVLEDMPPSIRFSKPGRDSQASAIEEFYLEVEGNDDYGVGTVELHFSVNGEEERTVSLFSQGGNPLREVSVGHTLYLEEYGLEAGDMISYYAVAEDNNGVGGRQSVMSDIYFLTVRPFGMEFREAPQQAGGQPQQGQQGEPETALSELQKEIVAATFNINRGRDDYTETQFSENVVSVRLAQERVRTQVNDLITRMQTRGPGTDPEFERILEELPKAMEEMVVAEAELEEEDTEDALAPEQRALLHLQKAEAMYEVYVSQSQQQGGGGQQQAQANAEDLADLFELELDKLQNQYEQVQRGEQQQVEEQIDESLERLKELARRQQQEADRQRRQAASGQQSSSSGGSSSQRDLAEQTEEAARELERLARQNDSPELQESAQRLQEAADAMRRSAAESGNSGTAEAERALDELEEARRLLERNRDNRLQRDTQGALDQARDLLEQQEEITERVGDLPASGQERADEAQQIIERKQEMAQDVERLERQLEQMASDAQGENAEAARSLREAARGIRENQLQEAIMYSRGLVQARTPETAQAFEEQTITPAMESLEQQIEQAMRSLEEGTTSDRMGDALDRAEDLVRGMESMQQRLQAQQNQSEQERRLGQQPGEEGQNPQGQEGEQGEPREGQEGQNQQGQQGQQGQEGQQGQNQQGQQGQQGQGQPGQQQGQNPQGQQGQQQGGQQAGGGTNPNGGFQGGSPENFSGGPQRPLTEEEIRQFRREIQERLTEGQELRQQLEAEGQDTEALEEALRAMQRLQDPEVYGRLDELAALQSQVVDGLKEFEYGLRRELTGDERELLLSGSDEVPEGFRRLVDEYYRSLARTRGGSGGN